MNIDFPVNIHLFGKSFLLHPVLESVGIFLAMRFYYFLKRKSDEKMSLNVSLAVLIGATAGALIGSKLIGNLENPYTLFYSDFNFKTFWTNNTIAGGLAFGLIGVELAKTLVGYKKSTGDLIVFPLIFAMIIGRIGCFFTGVYEETYGIPTNSIFGMYLGDEYKRHPVALYEIAFLITLWIVLRKILKSGKYHSGFVFQVFMLCYFLFRFLLDFIKPRTEILGVLGTIQIVCILMIIYYIYKIKNTLILQKSIV